MANIKKDSEKSDKTYPSKKNHTYNLRDMWRHYKKKCWEHKREIDGGPEWRPQLSYQQFKDIMSSLFLNMSEDLINNRPIELENFGLFYLKKYKSSYSGSNKLLNKPVVNPFPKKYFYRVILKKNKRKIPNLSFYKFKLHPEGKLKLKDK